MKADPFFASLDFAKIDRVEVRLFCKVFLGKFCVFPMLPNCFTEISSSLLNARHSRLGEQEAQAENTPHRGSFCSCIWEGFCQYRHSVGDGSVYWRRSTG